MMATDPVITPLEVVRIGETDSTNSWLSRNRSQLGAPALVYTLSQTAGRGQRGNTWEAEPGMNITASALLCPSGIEPARQFLISEAVALAVADTLLGYGIEAMVKWPNDIYVGDRKICGILIEHAITQRVILHTVAGVGLNVNQTVFRSDAPNPVSMANLTGKEYSLEEIAGVLAAAIPLRLAMAQGQPEQLHADFMAQLWRGDGNLHPFRTPADSRRFEARIEEVAPDGMLTLCDSDGLRRVFAFKEVEFII